jgi:hypothetical protein
LEVRTDQPLGDLFLARHAEHPIFGRGGCEKLPKKPHGLVAKWQYVSSSAFGVGRLDRDCRHSRREIKRPLLQ